MKTLRFKTNLNCKSCVAAVKPYLDAVGSIHDWSVDTGSDQKTLTVHGDATSFEEVRQAVEKGGFKVFSELPSSATEPSTDFPVEVSYYPLILILLFLIGVVGILELSATNLDSRRAMQNFMGGFFLIFSFFKLLDIRGFVESYRMYDVVTRRVPAYGFVYPFIELGLGLAYLANFQPMITNVVTLLVMSVSIVGVVQSLLAKKKIRCACLGTVFNLPMTTVTFIEDALMIVMAGVMLVNGHCVL